MVSLFRTIRSKSQLARAYYLRHGLRAAARRAFQEIWREQVENTPDGANSWMLSLPKEGLGSDVTADPLVQARVAIIGALDLPQCKKYRVLQKAEALEGHGCLVDLSSHEDVPRAYDRMQLATSVVFYRVPDGPRMRGYIDEARRLGIPALYDMDDPVFSRRVYEANRNLLSLLPGERSHLLDNTQAYLSAMRRCDGFIASTPYLARLIEEGVGGPVYLWRNAVDSESSMIAREFLGDGTSDADETNRPVRIGYLSGSRAHDADFQVAAEPLANLLSSNAHLKLVVAGYATLPEPLVPHEARIERRPFTSYRSYFETLRSDDIVIVPSLADEFNESKSAIRYMEAALVERPCVASKVGDFRNVVGENTGFLADSADAWQRSLQDLIDSPSERLSMGRRAREHVLSNYETRLIAEHLDHGLLDSLRGGRNG